MRYAYNEHHNTTYMNRLGAGRPFYAYRIFYAWSFFVMAEMVDDRTGTEKVQALRCRTTARSYTIHKTLRLCNVLVISQNETIRNRARHV